MLCFVALRAVDCGVVLCDEQTQMTSPIQSIPLYHGDNRGICLREHTNFYVVILVFFFPCSSVFQLPALPFFGWHHEEKNRLSDLLDEKFLLLILNTSVLSMSSLFFGAKIKFTREQSGRLLA